MRSNAPAGTAAAAESAPLPDPRNPFTPTRNIFPLSNSFISISLPANRPRLPTLTITQARYYGAIPAPAVSERVAKRATFVPPIPSNSFIFNISPQNPGHNVPFTHVAVSSAIQLLMKLPRVYPILDTESLDRRGISLETAAAAFLDGGAAILQIRHKSHWSRSIFESARTVARLSREPGPPLLLNHPADFAPLPEAARPIGHDDH